MITQIDQPTYVWCVLRLFDEFFTLFRSSVGVGGLGGIPKGLVQNLLVQFFTLESSTITTHILFDQIQAGPCIWQNATYPLIQAFLGLFAYPTPRGCIVGLTPCKTIVLSNTHIPQAVFGPEPPSDPLLKPTLLRGRGWRLWGEGVKNVVCKSGAQQYCNRSSEETIPALFLCPKS